MKNSGDAIEDAEIEILQRLVDYPDSKDSDILDLGAVKGLSKEQRHSLLESLKPSQRALLGVSEDIWNIWPKGREYLNSLKQYRAQLEQQERFHKRTLQQDEIFHKDRLKIEEKFEERRHKNERKALCIQTIAAILTALMVIFTGCTLWQNKMQNDDIHKSVEKQIELSDKQISSIAPVLPKIEIFLEDKSWDAQYLAYMRIANGSNGTSYYEREYTPITIVVRNLGEMDSGHVYVGFEPNESNLLFFKGIDFQNISGKSSKRINTKIYYNGCKYEKVSEPNEVERAIEVCNPSLIQPDKYNLTFVITCVFCDEKERRFYQNIEVCIWKDNSSMCSDYDNKLVV